MEQKHGQAHCQRRVYGLNRHHDLAHRDGFGKPLWRSHPAASPAPVGGRAAKPSCHRGLRLGHQLHRRGHHSAALRFGHFLRRALQVLLSVDAFLPLRHCPAHRFGIRHQRDLHHDGTLHVLCAHHHRLPLAPPARKEPLALPFCPDRTHLLSHHLQRSAALPLYA